MIEKHENIKNITKGSLSNWSEEDFVIKTFKSTVP